MDSLCLESEIRTSVPTNLIRCKHTITMLRTMTHTTVEHTHRCITNLALI